MTCVHVKVKSYPAWLVRCWGCRRTCTDGHSAFLRTMLSLMLSDEDPRREKCVFVVVQYEGFHQFAMYLNYLSIMLRFRGTQNQFTGGWELELLKRSS